MFSCEYFEIIENNFFIENPRISGSLCNEQQLSRRTGQIIHKYRFYLKKNVSFLVSEKKTRRPLRILRIFIHLRTQKHLEALTSNNLRTNNFVSLGTEEKTY